MSENSGGEIICAISHVWEKRNELLVIIERINPAAPAPSAGDIKRISGACTRIGKIATRVHRSFSALGAIAVHCSNTSVTSFLVARD